MRHAAAAADANAVRTPTGSVESASRASTPVFAAVSPKRESGVWISANDTPR